MRASSGRHHAWPRGPVALLLAGLVLAGSSRAAPDGGDAETARRARVAVRVGPRTVTVGELEDRLAEIPPFQAATFGASRDEIVKAFVDQVVVRDLVLGAGAAPRKLVDEPRTKQQLLRARSTATLRALRAEHKSPAAIPAADVARYYEDNRSRFDSPERINVWRILCKSREEAATVLSVAKRELTIAKYNELARDHSIDKATHLRGGNLGFLAPDGSSNEVGVKVEPALVKAAAAVKDGELVPDPVPEGSAFAVVWRRTTVPATKRSLEDATAQIRTTLFRERTEAAERKLIDDLRARNVRDYDPEPLKIVELPPFDAGLGLPRSIPGAATARPEAGPAAPSSPPPPR
jgi:peptidyl-prolyl cis-trans isomerase C